jgi:uncharacterized membrane protein
MAFLVEVLLWFVVELLLQLVGEALIGVGVESLSQSLGRREKPHWAVAGLGCFLIGGIAGLLVTLIYPHHVSPSLSLPYFAIVILPVLVGLAAFWLGERAEAAGRDRPTLATFWGGVLFALGMSLVRFLMLRGGWRLTSA